MEERNIFLSALEIEDPVARQAHLHSACAGDAGLLASVKSLLASHGQSQFLNTPVVEQMSEAESAETMLVGKGSTADEEYPHTEFFSHGTDVMNKHDDDPDENPLGYLLSFLQPAMRPDSKGQLAHYEIIEVLGRGAFGTVLKAFDTKLERVVAIKVLAPEMAATSPARKRFLREAKASAAIRHENVVAIHAVEEQPLPYLVMEYIPGQTLQQRLDHTGPLAVIDVLRMGRQIAEGLAAAGGQGLIHRDIKPGNILLEAGVHERIKITDFGLARAADDASLTQSSVIAGTPMYMAPEQALGKKLDQRADLFSLGSVLYQMVSGRPPFRAASTLAVLKRVTEDTPRPITEVIPETPQWLCQIITKLHEKNADDRYQSAQEVADVLANCEAQLKEHSRLKDLSLIPRAKVRSTGWWKVAMVLALFAPMLVIGLNVFMFNRPVSQPEVAETKVIESAIPESIKPVVTATSNQGVELLASSPTAPPLAIAPFDAAQARSHQEVWAKHLGAPVEYTNSIGMKFALIPPGEFTMGRADRDLNPSDKDFVSEWRPLATPQHRVRITDPYFMGTHEVTVEQFRTYIDATGDATDAESSGLGSFYFDADLRGTQRKRGLTWNAPGYVNGDRAPVTCLTWDDADRFCQWLSKKEGRTYLLPTEAEWENSCRAGTTTSFSYGPDLSIQQAVIGRHPSSGPELTCTRPANAFGLTDMHGNAAEWCQDGPRTYGVGVVSNPTGPQDAWRVLRGGTFAEFPAGHMMLQSSGRQKEGRDIPNVGYGFRIVLVGDLNPPISKPEPPQSTYANSIGMEFVIVPKGKSWLGGSQDKPGDREVEIPADFYLGKYEVTQEEWEKVMGTNPSHFSRTGKGQEVVKDIPDADLKQFPVERVSWDDCQNFVARLNERMKETGWVYRLPTSTEWEYACRGGPMSERLDSGFDFYFARPTKTLLPEQANFKHDEGLKRTSPVTHYEANRLGLFNMHGNVWEWSNDPEIDLRGRAHRVLVGGAWTKASERGTARFRDPAPYTDRFADLGIRLARVPSGVSSPETKTPPLAIAPFTDADVKRITALSAAEQVEEVRKELVKRNPGFDDTVKHKIEDGVVTEIRIVTDKVTDISPIRVFNALRVLGCGSTYTNGQLADLTPLKGMNLADLTKLDLADTKVTDAEMVYLKECKNLTALTLLRTQVGDGGLVHFRDCKDLAVLRLDATRVTDAGLAHLKGCKALTDLYLGYTRLSGAGLEHLKDLKNLRHVSMDHTRVGDAGLAHLKGMPLKKLAIDSTGITDLTPLQGMALEVICLTPKNITRGLEILREMKSLKTIGIVWGKTWAAAEFWDRYDEGEFGVALFTDADVNRIAALPAAEQVEEVRKELMQRNPNFDGKVGHKIEDGVVAEIDFVADHVSDIGPIRVFNTLRVLNCHGTNDSDTPNGQLEDLTPLAEMNTASLTHLNLDNTKVGDAGLRVFKDCKNLLELRLWHTKVSDSGLANFKDCKKLTLLGLNDTQVGDAGLANFKDFKNLTVLGLCDTRVSDAGLANFAACKNLTSLNLGRTQISDAGLIHFKDCKKLTELHLWDLPKIGDGGLANFQDCNALIHLNLARTKVTDVGLAHFKGCKSLMLLHLDGTLVTDAGLAIIKDCKNLTNLNFAQTQVAGTGLANLKGMRLVNVFMDNTPVTDLNPLQGMPLEVIYLTPGRITQGLEMLRDMKNLKTIGVGWDQAWPAAEFWRRYDKGEFN